MKKQLIWSSAVLMMILAPLLFVANGVCQDETETIRLSRQAAIAMAIRNNIDLRVRALDSSLAETDVEGSKAIYNPYLSASVNYAQTNVAGQDYGSEDITSVVGVAQKLSTGGSLSLTAWTVPTSAIADPLYDYTDWSSAIGITFYQPLLKNAGKEATELGISQDKYAYQASLESFRDEVIQTVFSVISDYNRLYVLYQLLESRQAELSSAQQLLEEIKTKDDNAAIELSNTEYALSQRQTEFIEATRQVSSKEASLRYLIGLEKKTHIVPLDPPSSEEPAETEEQAIALALEQSPELRELRIALESNELQEKVSKRNLWPDLALTATGGYRGYAQDGGFGDTVDQIKDGKGEYWSVGMRIGFPLGNDLAESEYRRNRLRSEQIRNQVTAAEWKVQDAIREDNRLLVSARLQMRATNKSKLLAEQRVAQYQKNRRLGTSSVKDLLDAENDLIFARNLELNAIERFANLVALLWKDIGVLLERQNIRIDTTRPDQVTGGGVPATLPDDKTAAVGVEASVVDTVVPREAPTTPATSEGKSPKVEAALSASIAESTNPVVDNPKPAIITGQVSYTLKVGEYLASEIESVKKKVERGGFVPVVMDSSKQEREVVRLLIGEYEDLSSARQALEPLKNVRRSGFILKNAAGGYDAFAGSFFTQQGAEAEQELLASRGFSLRLNAVSITLPSFMLTAGSFSSREAAMEGAKKLEQQGLMVEILES